MNNNKGKMSKRIIDPIFNKKDFEDFLSHFDDNPDRDDLKRYSMCEACYYSGRIFSDVEWGYTMWEFFCAKCFLLSDTEYINATWTEVKEPYDQKKCSDDYIKYLYTVKLNKILQPFLEERQKSIDDIKSMVNIESPKILLPDKLTSKQYWEILNNGQKGHMLLLEKFLGDDIVFIQQSPIIMYMYIDDKKLWLSDCYGYFCNAVIDIFDSAINQVKEELNTLPGNPSNNDKKLNYLKNKISDVSYAKKMLTLLSSRQYNPKFVEKSTW